MSETWDEVTKAATALREQWRRCAPPAADAVIDRCVVRLTTAIEAHAAATPLEALDAAERALLVAGGWRCRPTPGQHGEEWTDTVGDEGHAASNTWPRARAVLIERNRITARGGAS